MPMEIEHANDDDAFHEEARFLQHTIVAYLADHEDSHVALQWARDVLPVVFAKVFDHPDPIANARVCYWIVRGIWNALPLASNGFQPKPLPEPRQDEPCPCGSGDTYAACCMSMRSEPQPTLEALWPTLVMCRSDAYWLRIEKAGQLPTLGLVCAAALYHEDERWQPLKKLVEARLAVPQRCTDPDVAYLIDWLCDAYDALHSTSRKKLALLRRFADHQTPEVRGSANQRLATVLLDAGDKDAAWVAVEAARQALPNSPETALFEVTMLAGAGDSKRASERARHWRRRLADADVPEGLLRTLDAFAEDPNRVFESTLVEDLPPSLRKLLGWIDENHDRPLPQLRWSAMQCADDDETLRDAYQPIVDRRQRLLEEQWLAVSSMEKPFSTQSFSGAEEECWRYCDEWAEWLCENAQALDSMTILDDLAILLDAVPESLGGERNRWVNSIRARGAAIVAQHWPPEREGKLPWVVETNRPALRLLASFIEDMFDDWEDGRLERAMSLYLRLNPNDNHGFRSPLVNHLLTAGRDADALACAERFPEDMFAETRYGAVLALYRLGRLDEAESRLRQAQDDLPLVLNYLVRARVRRPKMDGYGIAIGGSDQAWLYREDMRDVWTQTDGALAWLREFRGENSS